MEDQSHDRKCHCSTTLRCGTANEGSNNHGDSHGVVGFEVGKVIVLENAQWKMWLKYVWELCNNINFLLTTFLMSNGAMAHLFINPYEKYVAWSQRSCKCNFLLKNIVWMLNSNQLKNLTPTLFSRRIFFWNTSAYNCNHSYQFLPWLPNTTILSAKIW